MAGRLHLPFGVCLLIIAGCARAPEPSGPPVDFASEVAPIVAARCTGCHSEGEIAPFSLTDYEEVARVAPLVGHAVEHGTMPPWPPGPDCNEYREDRSLSAAERDVLVRWVDQGAPGEPGTEIELAPAAGTSLPRVDMTIEMPEGYTPTVEPDEYRCIVLDWPRDAPSYVTGFHARPGVRSIVHHVIAWIAEPDVADEYRALDAADPAVGYECFGTPGGPWTTPLAAWAPGERANSFPEATGIRMDPGALVILQMHYNTSSALPEADRTAVDFTIADEVERPASFLIFTDLGWVLSPRSMHIPAGDPDVLHDYRADVTSSLSFLTAGVLDDGDFTVHGGGLHMHTRGTRGDLRVHRPDGAEACVMDIPRWDFDWQGNYWLADPIRISAGDELALSCRWDNTAGNQPVVAGGRVAPRDLVWGDGTNDEMCVGFLYVTTR